jgi:hypothetical protein
VKRRALIAVAVGIPLLLLAVAWQGGRYAALAAEARRVEAAQESWIEENRKLDASVRVLSSREKTEERAERMGLEKASPGQRLLIEGSAGTDGAATGGGATGGSR